MFDLFPLLCGRGRDEESKERIRRSVEWYRNSSGPHDPVRCTHPESGDDGVTVRQSSLYIVALLVCSEPVSGYSELPMEKCGYQDDRVEHTNQGEEDVNGKLN